MIRAVIIDLDGTVYRGSEEVPGAADFIDFLKRHSIRPLFVTNRSNRLPCEIVEHLMQYGIRSEEKDILTTSQAAAKYLKKGSAYCIGEKGLTDILAEAGMSFTDESPDYVIVGFDRDFNYEKLKKACRLIDNGAVFVATNTDKCLKTSNGVVPGTGAIVAAVIAGSGKNPIVIGKPERLIMDMALSELGMPAEEVVCIGDNIETDIPAGARAGMRTVLMLTGVSRRNDVDFSETKPTWICERYEELKNILLLTGSLK